MCELIAQALFFSIYLRGMWVGGGLFIQEHNQQCKISLEFLQNKIIPRYLIQIWWPWDPSSASVAFRASLLVIGKLFLLRWHWPRIHSDPERWKETVWLVKGFFFPCVRFCCFPCPFLRCHCLHFLFGCFQIYKKETMRLVEGRWYFRQGRATQEIYMKLHPEEWIWSQGKNRNSRHLQFILKHGKIN